MQKTIISILGRPLSGKDTVAHTLEQAFPNTSVVSMGDVLREVKATGPTHKYWDVLEESVRVAMSGGISPDEPVFTCFTQIVKDQSALGKEVFVWPGALRTEKQINMLDSWCREHGFEEQFIFINVSDEEILRRREERLELNRDDDQTEAFMIRLREFNRQTEPVIRRLQNEGRLMVIDGVGPKEVVGQRVAEALRPHLADPEISLPLMARR